jgi:hypothetical protein
MRITKDQPHHLEQLPEGLRPRIIDAHSYEFAPGIMPRDVERVWRAAQHNIWAATSQRLDINRTAYVHYCQSKMHVPQWVGNAIIEDLLTPVTHCHGDMTLSNAVQLSDGEIIFIDPGDPRGLPCRELDEAKLMQSTNGWEEVRWGADPTRGVLPFVIKPIHMVLLYTHLGRLLCHEHPQPALDWAKGAMESVDNIMGARR